jgi:hypothetical protein
LGPTGVDRNFWIGIRYLPNLSCSSGNVLPGQQGQGEYF